MPRKLERWYGLGHLHFITTSCYHRLPFLDAPKSRDIFLRLLDKIRGEFDFALLGYVVMPEHVHLLISEPNIGDPSSAMKALKERTAHSLGCTRFWTERFYDFNVYSPDKKFVKLNYMHFNPVKRGLVEKPDKWAWSSCRFYTKGENGLCPPNPKWTYKEKTAMKHKPQLVKVRGM